MNRRTLGRRADSEGVMIAIRWAAFVFAALQTATYYRPIPADVLPWAWGTVAALGLSAVVLTAWWHQLRGPEADPRARRRFAFVSIACDMVVASAMTWVYAFDVETAIFAVVYLAAIEVALRFGLRGAVLGMAALTTSYVAREAWATWMYGYDFLVVSITFRMGIGLIVACAAGAVADRYEREHRSLQAALEGAREAAASLRSLDELRSTFLMSVSHELRTPLTSILGFSLTMRERAPELSDETRGMLDQVIAEARQLERLAQDLVDIERMGRRHVAISRTQVDVGDLARRGAERVARRAHREILVEAPPALSAMLDAPKVERIVDNLLGNAVRYSPEEEPVRLAVRRIEGGVLLVVDDAGPGVPEQLRRSIFQPFERGSLTSAHQPGTGIGLSVVDRFARLHGGAAWVEDRECGSPGASFRVSLPDGEPGIEHVLVADQPWGGGSPGGS